MRYRCTKTHYHPDDRAMKRGERRVIKKGDTREFAVAPRSSVWVRDDGAAAQPAATEPATKDDAPKEEGKAGRVFGRAAKK